MCKVQRSKLNPTQDGEHRHFSGDVNDETMSVKKSISKSDRVAIWTWKCPLGSASLRVKVTRGLILTLWDSSPSTCQVKWSRRHQCSRALYNRIKNKTYATKSLMRLVYVCDCSKAPCGDIKGANLTIYRYRYLYTKYIQKYYTPFLHFHSYKSFRACFRPSSVLKLRFIHDQNNQLSYCTQRHDTNRNCNPSPVSCPAMFPWARTTK